MPITEDIRNHSLFRREYEQGLQQGVEQGESQLEDLAMKFLDVNSLEELLP